MGKEMSFPVALNSVQHHGGFLESNSPPGNEDTYNVVPDVETPTPKHPTDEKGHARSPAGKAHGTILLVDDDEMILDVMSEMLALAGYTVVTANSGSSALDTYRNRSTAIDLVLLDIIMPELNGDVVFEKLKQINPNIKVICLSGYCADHTVEKMLAGGCCGYFPKPINFTELSNQIHNIISTTQSDETNQNFR